MSLLLTFFLLLLLLYSQCNSSKSGVSEKDIMCNIFDIVSVLQLHSLSYFVRFNTFFAWLIELWYYLSYHIVDLFMLSFFSRLAQVNHIGFNSATDFLP